MCADCEEEIAELLEGLEERHPSAPERVEALGDVRRRVDEARAAARGDCDPDDPSDAEENEDAEESGDGD
jgi:hypothetical protein